MEYRKIQNEMLAQVRSAIKDISETAGKTQISRFMESIPVEKAKNASTILLAGCGDCYAASIAACYLFESLGLNAEALRSIDAARYYNTYRGWDINTEECLLVAISVSGSPKRLSEAVQRFNALDAMTIAFTGNPSSMLGRSAQNIFKLEVPAYGLAPNVASYISSLFSLQMFALYIAIAKSKITSEQAFAIRNEILAYSSSYESIMDIISESAFNTAAAWHKADIGLIEFIGDGPDYATAFFGSAKTIEASGILANSDDTEEWCHIGHFVKEREHTAAVIIANTCSPSYGRAIETIRTICSLRPHVLVITDGRAEEIPESAEVITIPRTDSIWLHPIMEHIPLDFIAAYLGVLKGAEPFRINSPLHQKDAPGTRYLATEIKLIKEI